MPFDFSSINQETGFGGDNPWPEDCVSPYQMMRICDLFHNHDSGFLETTTDDDHAAYIEDVQDEAIYKHNSRFFDDLERWGDFIKPVNVMITSFSSVLRGIAEGSVDYSKRGCLEAMSYISQYDRDQFADKINEMYTNTSPPTNFTTEHFFIKKTVLRDWIEHRYNHGSKGQERPGSQEFSEMMKKIEEIMDIGKTRGTGWAQG